MSGFYRPSEQKASFHIRAALLHKFAISICMSHSDSLAVIANVPVAPSSSFVTCAFVVFTYADLHFYPHCCAIARAMPGYVFERCLDRSSALHFERERESCLILPFAATYSYTSFLSTGTMFVGCNNGKPFNHKHVAFVVGCPNIQGWMVCSGLRQCVFIQPIGFSTAIFGMSAFASVRKNSAAASRSFIRCRALSPYRSTLNQRFPVTVR